MILITKAITFMGGKRTEKREVREMTEQEERAFAEAMRQMDEALTCMNTAFEALRKL